MHRSVDRDPGQAGAGWVLLMHKQRRRPHSVRKQSQSRAWDPSFQGVAWVHGLDALGPQIPSMPGRRSVLFKHCACQGQIAGLEH